MSRPPREHSLLPSLSATKEHLWWRGKEDISQVADVYDFPDDTKTKRLAYGTAVRLKERYQHVLVVMTLDQPSVASAEEQEEASMIPGFDMNQLSI